MADKPSAIPEPFHAVTPHLVCADAAAAIDFYKAAFGAEELTRLPAPNGKLMHASVKIGDSVVMLVDEMPEYKVLGPKSLNGNAVTIHLYVADADATFARAVAAGATPKMPVMEMFWGDRYGQIVDPSGHSWSIATHVKDLTPAQIQEGMAKMPPPTEPCN